MAGERGVRHQPNVEACSPKLSVYVFTCSLWEGVLARGTADLPHRSGGVPAATARGATRGAFRQPPTDFFNEKEFYPVTEDGDDRVW